MKKRSETKLVIIGFGALMQYIRPCYEGFLGKENLGNNIIAVKGIKDIDKLREAFPFEIRLHDNLSALRDLEPDIILFAPPPTLVPILMEDTLKVYYNELREKKMPLPDLYAFAPSPQGDYYLDELGADIHVCNILPNLFHGVGGSTFLTYPDQKHWPTENKKRMEAFFQPLGDILEVGPATVLRMLATMVTIEIIKLGLFTIDNALAAAGMQGSYQELAAYLRAYHEQQRAYFPANCVSFNEISLDRKIQTALSQYYQAWFRALQDFINDSGLQPDVASQILNEVIDLDLYVCQMEDKNNVEQSIKDHATKGGVLERGCMCFELLMKDKVSAVFSGINQDSSCTEFFEWVNASYKVIGEIVALHCERLSGIEPPFVFTQEVFAVSLALFSKNLIKSGVEKDFASITAGINLPVDLKASEIVDAWRKYGLLDEARLWLERTPEGLADKNNTAPDWQRHSARVLAEISRNAHEKIENADQIMSRTYADIAVIFGSTAAASVRDFPA